MASTQTFSEGNGASAGTETTSVPNMNWQSQDAPDTGGTTYQSHPVVANTNSFTKYQALVFAGTWNSLSALTVAVDNNSPQTGVTINGKVYTTATGTTPSATSSGDGLFPTTATAVNFTGTTWATVWGTGASSSTASGTLYSQPIRTQLAVASNAAPGDIATRTFTWTWTES